MPIEKVFVLTHVFKDVSSMKHDEKHFSPIEEHFGVPWHICARRYTNHFGLHLYCEQKKDKVWSIETWMEMKVCAVDGKEFSIPTERTFKNADDLTGWGWLQFITWEDMMKDYMVDDTLKVEIRVTIKKMTGIAKKNLMSFDESNRPFSDVVLVVENQKFFVSKLFLAAQSPFFKSTLLKVSEAEELSEHTLKDVKAGDFQNFLELLHGESPIDDSTVDGIVHLADVYDAELAIRKCERFLIESSEKSLKENLQLAHRYNLNNLKDHCLSKITTAAEIRSVLAYDASEMDPSVVGELLQKALALHNK